jgi:hypothetical protein
LIADPGPGAAATLCAKHARPEALDFSLRDPVAARGALR